MPESYSPFIRSEIDYRRQRLQSGTAASSRTTQRHRFPRVRRTAVTDDAR